MKIEYKDVHRFEREELQRLFLSVEWSSGRFPDKLVVAMQITQPFFLPGMEKNSSA